MSDTGLQPIADRFVSNYFAPSSTQVVGDAEQAVLGAAQQYVESRLSQMKYILGLGIDFCVLAEQIASHDPKLREFEPELDERGLFERYTLVTQRGKTQANTLTLEVGKGSYGIRSIEENVRKLFYALDRPSYPSAYVYNTGQWHKYKELLVMAFQLSSTGRRLLVEVLIRLGLKKLPQNTFFSRSSPRVAVFPAIISDFPRSAPDENAGLTFQSIAYGFFKADRPHLSVVASGVRTGSSRQQRIGDIDCYGGLDLESSVEVKDLDIDEKNLKRELGQFMSDVAERGVAGVAFVRSVSPAAAEELCGAGIDILDEELVTRIVQLWDWPKQDSAVIGMLHFLAHVEQNAKAVQRLLAFIRERDSAHSMLDYADPPNESSS